LLEYRVVLDPLLFFLFQGLLHLKFVSGQSLDIQHQIRDSLDALVQGLLVLALEGAGLDHFLFLKQLLLRPDHFV